MDKLNAISIFCKVIETQSFTLAAKQQNISVAMASKLVSQLEEHLKTRLLQRTTRKIMPTEAGMMYYQLCQGILLDLDEADSSIILVYFSSYRTYRNLLLNILIYMLKLSLMTKKLTLWQKAMILHYISAIWRTVLLYHEKSAQIRYTLWHHQTILKRMVFHKHLMIWNITMAYFIKM